MRRSGMKGNRRDWGANFLARLSRSSLRLQKHHNFTLSFTETHGAFCFGAFLLAFIIKWRPLQLLLSQSCMAAETQIVGRGANNSVKECALVTLLPVLAKGKT